MKNSNVLFQILYIKNRLIHPLRTLELNKMRENSICPLRSLKIPTLYLFKAGVVDDRILFCKGRDSGSKIMNYRNRRFHGFVAERWVTEHYRIFLKTNGYRSILLATTAFKYTF